MVAAEVLAALESIPGLSGLIKIGQVAGVFVIVYVGFLIVKGVLQMKQVRRLSRLVDTLNQVNDKLDKIVKNTSKKSKKK